MLSKLRPHSILLKPKVSKAIKVISKGQFDGLGIVISLRDSYLTVISPIEETPAYKAGIKPLDRVIKIDDDLTIDLELDDIINIDSVSFKLLSDSVGYVDVKAFHIHIMRELQKCIAKMRKENKGIVHFTPRPVNKL